MNHKNICFCCLFLRLFDLDEEFFNDNNHTNIDDEIARRRKKLEAASFTSTNIFLFIT